MNKGIWVIIPLITLVAMTSIAVNLYQAYAATEITSVTVDRVNSAKQGTKVIIHANLEGDTNGDIEIKVCARGANNPSDVCSAPISLS